MTGGAQNISKQIGLITGTNRERTAGAARILTALEQAQQLLQHQIQGIQGARRIAAGLSERASALAVRSNGDGAGR